MFEIDALNDFTKSLRILYVEDESDAREILLKYLNKICNNVIVAENGVSGFIKYKEAKDKNEPIDIIITDINMPKMNGIEMIQKMQELVKNLNIILVTARNEEKNLYDAITLGVSSYITKPIDFDKFQEAIEKITEKIFYKFQSIKKQKELERYTQIIENVAVITKTDTKGIITYADEAFCKVTGYTKEELIGQNHNIVRHPDNSKEQYSKLWENIKNGETWEGKVKNIDKNGNTWYAKSSIFPMYDNSGKIYEYVAVRFLITDEYEEKRELNNKLIKSVVGFKKEISNYQHKAEDLEKILYSKDETIKLLTEKIQHLKQKKQQLLNQLSEYESSSNQEEKEKIEILKRKNEELHSRTIALNKMKEEKDELIQRVKELEKKVETRNLSIDSYKQDIQALKQKIKTIEEKETEEKKKKSFF